MKVSFVIPFHNEEKNSPKMIDRVVSYAQKAKMHFEVIPIDDRSTDATGEILRKLARKYKNIVKPVFRKKDKEEKGNTMGKALKEGTKQASGSVVIWTMGDLADDTKTFGEIID